MTRRQTRMLAVGGLVLGTTVAVALALVAFNKNLMYFYSPADVVAGEPPADARFRLGGIVRTGSVARADEGLEVRFTLEDCTDGVPVSYSGILPDLFREGQGIVAMGKLDDGVFVADEVLAKHDENYMPPELVEAMRDEQGDACMPANMGEGYTPNA